jgi:hypothetical protein
MRSGLSFLNRAAAGIARGCAVRAHGRAPLDNSMISSVISS